MNINGNDAIATYSKKIQNYQLEMHKNEMSIMLRYYIFTLTFIKIRINVAGKASNTRL